MTSKERVKASVICRDTSLSIQIKVILPRTIVSFLSHGRLLPSLQYLNHNKS